MCAVFGILGDYNPVTARSALASMTHRGPDACGIVEQERLFFAHNRLSIIDLSSNATQPMRHGDILLSFNGEIYNHKALREQLDFPYRSESDSEVLIAAYMKWGVRFVDHLIGMFAIALFDNGKLCLFRDRLGKKPLFYTQQRGCFAFASEIKALRPFLDSYKLNDDALMSYLGFLAPTPPHTFYQGIQKLESGSYLCYEAGKSEVHVYYDLLETPRKYLHQRDKAVEAIGISLHESIGIRLDADVPMAALLSGGIDSALLCAIAKAKGRQLQTFTLGYEGFSNYDERENAAVTAAHIGVRNTGIEITQTQFIEAADAVFETMDEPLNDPAAVPLYLLFEAIAKEGYRVVFSGEGSDELFLGYRQYFEYLDIEKARSLAHKNWLKKYFRSNFSMNREWEWYKRVFDDTLLFRTSGEKFTDMQKNILMRRNVRDNDGLKYLAPYRERFEASAFEDESFWYSYIDLKLFQAEHFLAKLDRVSMAHSIESRTPYLDHRLAETVFSLSPSLRYEEGKSKALLKSVALPYLGTSIVARKKKGFSNPYMEWLDASGRIKIIEEVNAQTGLFHPDVLAHYIKVGRKGRFKQHVWGLYTLSCWIKRWML